MMYQVSSRTLVGVASCALLNADGMSKAAVAFLAKQLAAENTHSGKSACSSMS